MIHILWEIVLKCKSTIIKYILFKYIDIIKGEETDFYTRDQQKSLEIIRIHGNHWKSLEIMRNHEKL
jgi:hypothetical protein